MTVIIAGIVIVLGIVAALAVAVGIPVVLGLMAYDTVTSDRRIARAAEGRPAPVRTEEQMGSRIRVERSVARAFVILGGAFWALAVFSGLYMYRESGFAWSVLAAGIPFVATLVTLILGWYYERFTAALLVIASAGVVYWGVINQYEAGAWGLAILSLIGPMLTAAVLFWLARREQEALDVVIAERIASGPELAPATASTH